jgi:hypothetical protein
MSMAELNLNIEILFEESLAIVVGVQNPTAPAPEDQACRTGAGPLDVASSGTEVDIGQAVLHPRTQRST